MYVYSLADQAREIVDGMLPNLIAVGCLLVLAVIVRWVLHRLVDRLVRGAVGAPGSGGITEKFAEKGTPGSSRRAQRAKTLGDLFKSIITGLVVAIFTTMILGQLGINIAPIIASAGIVGLALGFGAQSLVKDFVSGVFLIMEDQFGVGDVVDVGEAIGTVEQVTLRVTRLRALDGTVWYVPNGEILRVGNMSQNWSCAVIDVRVAYQEDLVRVKQVLGEVAHGIWDDEDYSGIVIEEPEVTGVEALDPDSVTVRMLIKTAPLEQWAVAREMRQRIKARFDHEGIEIPFAQRVIWHREQKSEQEAEEAQVS